MHGINSMFDSLNNLFSNKIAGYNVVFSAEQVFLTRNESYVYGL